MAQPASLGPRLTEQEMVSWAQCSVIRPDCFPALNWGMFKFGDTEHSALVEVVWKQGVLIQHPTPQPHSQHSSFLLHGCLLSNSCGQIHMLGPRPMGKGESRTQILHDRKLSCTGKWPHHTGWFIGPCYPTTDLSVIIFFLSFNENFIY